MTIRLSDYHDAPVLQALYEASGKAPYPYWNWSCNTHGWWLLAEDAERRPLGCVQLYLSQPQAFMDLLCVPAVLPVRTRARIIYRLMAHAKQVLASFGVRTCSFQADAQDQTWTALVQRYGGVPVHSHPTYVLQVM